MSRVHYHTVVLLLQHQEPLKSPIQLWVMTIKGKPKVMCPDTYGVPHKSHAQNPDMECHADKIRSNYGQIGRVTETDEVIDGHYNE